MGGKVLDGNDWVSLFKKVNVLNNRRECIRAFKILDESLLDAGYLIVPIVQFRISID